MNPIDEVEMLMAEIKLECIRLMKEAIRIKRAGPMDAETLEYFNWLNELISAKLNEYDELKLTHDLMCSIQVFVICDNGTTH